MSVINESNSVSANNGDYNDVLFLTADAEEDNHIKSFNDEDFTSNSNNISLNNNHKNTSKLTDENNSFNLQISIDAGNCDFDADNHKNGDESSLNYNHDEVLNVNINNHDLNNTSDNNVDGEKILREQEHPSNTSYIHEITTDSLSKEDNSLHHDQPLNDDIITYSNNNEFNKNLDVSVDYALSDAKQQIINDILINDLKYLFKNTRYFLIKSNNYENVNLAKNKVCINTFIFKITNDY
jgi:hypothetical protein